jgi:hypothetical protein
MSYYPDDPRDDPDRWQERDRRDPWEQPARAASSAPSLVGPAVMLFVLALLNLLGGLGGLALGVYFYSMDLEEFQATMTEDDSEGLDWAHDMGWSDQQSQQVIARVYVGLGVGSLLASLLLALGGFAMMARKFYALALLGAITAFVSPGGCCVFGVVGGIWSLVALIDPHVRRSFT